MLTSECGVFERQREAGPGSPAGLAWDTRTTEQPSAEMGKSRRSKSQGTEAERRPGVDPQSVGSPSQETGRGVEGRQAGDPRTTPVPTATTHLPSKHLSSGRVAQWDPLLGKSGPPTPAPARAHQRMSQERGSAFREAIAMIPQPEPLTQPRTP